MGAMKNWAMIIEELDAAREHWESCDAARMQAILTEAEAYDRLRAAQREHDAMVRDQLAGCVSRTAISPPATVMDADARRTRAAVWALSREGKP